MGTINAVTDEPEQQPLVYPNPATATLLFNGEMQPATIYDAIGTTVWSGTIGNGMTIDCSSWASGVYVVQCKGKTTSVLVMN